MFNAPKENCVIYFHSLIKAMNLSKNLGFSFSCGLRFSAASKSSRLSRGSSHVPESDSRSRHELQRWTRPLPDPPGGVVQRPTDNFQHFFFRQGRLPSQQSVQGSHIHPALLPFISPRPRVGRKAFGISSRLTIGDRSLQFFIPRQCNHYHYRLKWGRFGHNRSARLKYIRVSSTKGISSMFGENSRNAASSSLPARILASPLDGLVGFFVGGWGFFIIAVF